MNSLNKINILLVEDDPISQQFIVELLLDYDASIHIACNGMEAVSFALGGKNFDIILMDAQMPEMGGVEATLKIREHLKDIPIIAMTATSIYEEKQDCLRAGMNDLLLKPINPESLFQILEKFAKPKIELPSYKSSEQSKRSIDFPKELPPFDLILALEQVGGNKEFLKKLIIDFYNKHKNTIEEIKNSNHEKQTRLAHTLKGISGTLAIPPLHKAASNLEHALRNNILNDLPKLFSELELELNSALNASRLLAELQSTPLEKKETSSHIDYSKIAELINQLKAYLSIHNMKAKKYFMQLKEELAFRNDIIDIMIQLENQVNFLDFELALQTLESLEKRINSL